MTDGMTYEELKKKYEYVMRLVNTPELNDFAQGVVMEAIHQNNRWGPDHDREKTPLEWFWVLGHLANKATFYLLAGDYSKAKHHLISTAALCNNWHAKILEMERNESNAKY